MSPQEFLMRPRPPRWLAYALMALGAALLVLSTQVPPDLALLGMVIGILLAITGVVLAMADDSLEPYTLRRKAHR